MPLSAQARSWCRSLAGLILVLGTLVAVSLAFFVTSRCGTIFNERAICYTGIRPALYVVGVTLVLAIVLFYAGRQKNL
jgi:hypothetical protein